MNRERFKIFVILWCINLSAQAIKHWHRLDVKSLHFNTSFLCNLPVDSYLKYYSVAKDRYWMAFIKIVGDEEKIAICGGSIISPKYILSAAHCFCDQKNCEVNVEFF